WAKPAVVIWHVHPETPQKPQIERMKTALQRGGIFIVPTDTVYAFVCSLDAPRAINELYKLKGMSEKQSLSLLCKDVAMAGVYAQSIPNHIFRFIKAMTPGPYTFIFKANRNMD